MTRRFHIGELSARTGRGIHAIRWYESQGLVPGVRRDGGGRRTYVDLHVGWLDLIDRLRHTGMSIKEMRDYVELVTQGEATLDQRRALLMAHRERLEQHIAELRQSAKLIDNKIAFYEEWLNTGEQPELPEFKA